MKKIKFLVGAMLFFLCGNAQIYIPVVPTAYGEHNNRIRVDSAILGPTGCGAPTSLRSAFVKQYGQYYDSCNKKFYLYDPKLLTWDTLHIGVSAIGTITGSGTTNYIPKFTSSTALGNSAVYDNSGSVGIGTTSPYSTLNIQKNSIAANQTDSTGIILENSTAATSGVPVQLSPGFVWKGKVWETSFGGSSRTQSWRADIIPFSLSGFGRYAYWQLGHSENGGAYTAYLKLSSRGNLDVYNAAGTAYGSINSNFIGASTLGALYWTSTNAPPLNYTTVSGAENTASGLSALYNISSGSQNTATGSYALQDLTTSNLNTATGFQAGLRVTIGTGQNSFFGANSGLLTTTGFKNTFIGAGAGENNTTGQENTMLGQDAGLNNTTGIYNFYASVNAKGGSDGIGNNIIGYYSGASLTSGNQYNVGIGHNALYHASQKVDATKSTAIGYNAYTTANNQLSISDSTTRFTFPGVSRGTANYVMTDSLGTGQYWVARPLSAIGIPISSLTASAATNSITVGHAQAWNYNGITTGIGHRFTSNSITSGSIFDITGTSTALASGNEGLNIDISGANSTNGIPVTGAKISVTNTNATSGTNVGLEVTASGATTGNYAALFTGRVGIGTLTPTDQLHVATGAAVLNQISTHTTATSANFYTGSDGTANGASSTTPYLFGGASSVAFRIGINGASATNIPVNNSYSTLVVASSVIGEEASGTHGFIGSAVFKPPTISSGVATVTNTSTVYITDAPSATVTGSNSSLWVGAGITRFGTAGTSLGSFTLEGNTSGVVTVQPAAAAGTWSLTLPTNDGDASQVLTTDGSGVTSWTTPSGGSPTGNFGNLQIGRNSAFATPASDSLDFESATGLSVKGDVRTTTSLYLPSSSSEGLRFGTTVRMYDNGSLMRESPSAGVKQQYTAGSNGSFDVYNSDGGSYIHTAPLSGTGSVFETLGSATNLKMQTTAAHTLMIGNGTAVAKTNILSTTEQLRLMYDASNYVAHTVSSAGVYTVAPTGVSITVTKPVVLKGYTVATLPAGVEGMTAYCTDLLAPTFGATAVGGGAVKLPVFFDGTNWVVY